MKDEQIYNEHREVFDELNQFEKSSYDEEDTQDVDYGNGRLFIDTLVSGEIATLYSELLFNYAKNRGYKSISAKSTKQR